MRGAARSPPVSSTSLSVLSAVVDAGGCAGPGWCSGECSECSGPPPPLLLPANDPPTGGPCWDVVGGSRCGDINGPAG
uniref:Putative secreted protein n=1 Tax=Anopheles marajoara TaxID=58244 RepID=A0A2M4CC57_9DIPT